MRKPRDYDAELQALTDKAKALKAQKQGQLGALVIGTSANALSAEELAGALLAASHADAAQKEVWRKSGAAFFLRNAAKPRRNASPNEHGAAASSASPQSPAGETSAP
jgi:hypothetical protein